MLVSLLFVYISFSSSSFFMLWVYMEMILLWSVPLVVQGKESLGSVRGVMYYSVQAISSIMMILSLLLIMFMGGGKLITSWLTLVLFFKSGVPPFHMWQLSLFSQSSFFLIVVLSSYVKWLPFYMLSLMLSPVVWLGVFASGLFGPLLMYYQKSIKLLLISSSLYMNSWFLTAMWLGGIIWMMMWLVYMAWFVLTLMCLSKLSALDLSSMDQANHLGTKFMLMVVVGLMGLSGVPPFPSFLIKLKIMCMMAGLSSSVLWLFLLVGAALSIFAYLKFLFSSFLMSNSSFFYMYIDWESSKYLILWMFSAVASLYVLL